MRRTLYKTIIPLLGSMLALTAGHTQESNPDVGTKLVWRYTSGSFAGGEVTTYIMGDRRRTEFHNTSMKRQSDGSFSLSDPPANVVIDRCDLGLSFGLNTDSHEYSQHRFPPKPLTPEEMKASGWDDSDWDTAKLPAVRVEVTTVDTGEREIIFDQPARHVITTIKTTLVGNAKDIPSPPAAHLVSHGPWVRVKDGWYIDYERRVSCEPVPETKVHSFGGLVEANHLFRTEKTETILIGPLENGLLVRGEVNPITTSTISGSNGVNVRVSDDNSVTQFYRGPLDPALFAIPTGFVLGNNILFQ
jgi:hypothetical protein